MKLVPIMTASLLLFSALASARPVAATEPARVDDPAPEDVLVGGDPKQRYFLHAPEEDTRVPPQGWRLLVVMPGGNGGADFAPFVGRIRENALSKEWLIAQIVAPLWDDKQSASIVWPTKRNPWPKMEFSSEELFAAVVKDVAAKRELDPRYLFTLSWSSSGTLAYLLALDPDSGVTGSFVAMSVFKPDQLPPLKTAKGRPFYILHSPEDAICAFPMAEEARDELTEADALVEFATYTGGHGWHGDVFGNLRTGVGWLERQAKKAKLRKRAR